MLLLGAALDAVLIYNYGGVNVINLILDLITASWRPAVESLGVIVGIFVLPIGLSIYFDMIGYEERLVPPFYMQIGAFVLIFTYVYNQINYSNLFPYLLSFYILGVYVIVGGLTQDRIAVSVLGRSCPGDQIVRKSFRVSSGPNNIRTILGAKHIRDHLSLRLKVWRTERGLIFKSRRRVTTRTAIEIVPSGEPNESFVNFAFFERTRYELQRTPDVEEEARGVTAYFKDVLHRPENAIAVDDAPEENAEFLVTTVIDEYQGFSDRMREASLQKMVALIGTLIFWGLTGVFVWISQVQAALATLAIAVYVSYESYGVWKEN
jgi:hypothetical protein